MSNNGRHKVAFITGGASGIGRASCKVFASDGFAVAVVDRNRDGGNDTAKAIREAGGEAIFVSCDVADDDSVRDAVACTVAEFGRLDAAFNAAGIDVGAGLALTDCPIDIWNRMIAVNLTGVWNCMRHEINQMVRNGGGAIVNCSSTSGIRGFAGYGAYTAAKHGVVGLTRTGALEFAPKGIRINAICPGPIDTPMTKNDAVRQSVEQLVPFSPARRIGQPDEIGSVALWLCSDGASYFHGQVMPVDGGMTA